MGSTLLAPRLTGEVDRLRKGAELGITARRSRKLVQGRRQCGSGMQRGWRDATEASPWFFFALGGTGCSIIRCLK